MFLIVEGFDNTGKSFLVNQLSNDLKLLVLNNRKRPQTVSEARCYLDLMLPMARHFPTILDRLAVISEPVYGPICRKTHLFSLSQIEFQLEVMKPMHPLVIYCRPPDSVVLNFGEREQMDGVITHAPELLKKYDSYMAWLQSNWLQVISYDWKSDSYEDLRNRAAAHLKGRP